MKPPTLGLRVVRGLLALAGLALVVISLELILRQFDALESPPRAHSMRVDAPLDDIAATYEGVFRGTVYYTPIESGFTREDGFDVALVTRSGLRGKLFPKDFLKAVEIEGFGRMVEAFEGKSYVKCCRGVWGYAAEPLDRKGQPLQPQCSTAIAYAYEMVQFQSAFRVRAEGLPPAFLDARWIVSDTGSALQPQQIDFYWGEDAPLGPGRRLSRPKGLPNPIVNPTILVLR
jgi:hypothetical protein